jgi:4-diphosphocytidyl-2C-methyl-D-erythritol kinase
MEEIRVKCPAKINLTLEVLDKRDDGFHNIKSVMQTISLYDFLTISACPSEKKEIALSGTNSELPYDNTNLVYKAVELYLKEAELDNMSVKVFIEKHIPVSAGLAGGSSDAAGTLWGLNQLLEKFSDEKLRELCASLGSDVNVCLEGGCLLATSRGEVTEKLPVLGYSVTIVKPKDLGISAKEAYEKYDNLEEKPQNGMTDKMVEALNNGKDIKEFLYNALEPAVINEHKELQAIKNTYPQMIMTGSGSAFYALENTQNLVLCEGYQYKRYIAFTGNGVGLCEN